MKTSRRKILQCRSAFAIALAWISLGILPACTANVSGNNTSARPAPPIPPALGQSYGTTDRELSAYKWSNSDNTQEPNIYKIPLGSGSVTARVTYASTPDGKKRVSDVHYYNFNDATWESLKSRYIPKDASKYRLSEIGGNIQQVFGTDDAHTATSYFYSRSLAETESKARVRPCVYDSNKRGLLIVQYTLNDDASVGEVYITDAALHYCGKLL